MVARTEELREALENVGFPEENIITLYNESATSQTLHRTLTQFWEGGSHSDADRLVVYFGGHGQSYQGGVRLITYDYDPKRPSLTTFDAREFPESESRNIVSHQVLFIMDVCHAGLAVYRSLDEPKHLETDLGRLSVVKAYTTPVARNILVAGTENEDALWDNGGIFTQALVQGLKGAADTQKMGLITFDNLASYVRSRVVAKAAETGVTQVPTEKILDLYGSGRMVFLLGQNGSEK
jgi:uncharacterized caspase-like protein